MPYDHPNYITRREISMGETAAGSGTVHTKYANFQRLRLKSVQGVITVAGTSTSPGHALTLRTITGTTTTSVGLLALGTGVAGAVVSSGALNLAVEPGTHLTLTNGTDGTGRCIPVFETEIFADAVQTV